ncbi:MAG: pseudouridine synthase [Thermoanaerobaculia bacterium]
MSPARRLPPGDRPFKTLERIVSKAGLGSRTEARRWISEGKLSVNGRVVRDPDHWVDLERDGVELEGRPLAARERVHLLLHKPTGYLTTHRDPQGRPTIWDLLPDRNRYLFSVGRLDLDTSGLLILTNDAEFAERMTNPEYKVPKTYQVKASTHLRDEQLEMLRLGVELRDGPTRPALVERLREPGGKTVFAMTIVEGRNRQVRRMVEAVGSKVVSLARIAIGPIAIGELEPGKHRALTREELEALLRAANC